MKTAADVMNRTFFHASPSDTIGLLLHEMAERGLGCVPVLDATGRPLGVATTGEIEPCYDIDELIEHLARPAICVDQNTPVDIAARELAQHPSCALILVDGGGVAVGALSPIELLRAVVGVEAGLASTPARDVGWESADVLELGAAHRAPAAPGVILLSPGVDEGKKRRVWAEAAGNMRERLDQMLREPQREEGLESILAVYPRTVRFRCLTVEDAARREELAEALCNIDVETGPRPHQCFQPASPPRTPVATSGPARSAPIGAPATGR